MIYINFEGLPDKSVNVRIPSGPLKSMRMHKAPDSQLRYFIEHPKNEHFNNAAFDEYQYREKLGLIGDNP